MPRIPDRGVQPDDEGFTLIEMMVTVVIMGIIIAPLTMLLIQSMLVVPQSSARTQAATDRDHLQEVMTGDIAQANHLDVYAAPPGDNTAPRTVVDATYSQGTWDIALTAQQKSTFLCPADPAVTAFQLFSTVSWDASRSNGQLHSLRRYTLLFTAAGADTAGNRFVEVEVHRSTGTSGNADPGADQPLQDDGTSALSGYCRPNEQVAAVAATAPAGSNADVTVELDLRDNANEPPVVVTIDGAPQVRPN